MAMFAGNIFPGAFFINVSARLAICAVCNPRKRNPQLPLNIYNTRLIHKMSIKSEMRVPRVFTHLLNKHLPPQNEKKKDMKKKKATTPGRYRKTPSN